MVERWESSTNGDLTESDDDMGIVSRPSRQSVHKPACGTASGEELCIIYTTLQKLEHFTEEIRKVKCP